MEYVIIAIIVYGLIACGMFHPIIYRCIYKYGALLEGTVQKIYKVKGRYDNYYYRYEVQIEHDLVRTIVRVYGYDAWLGLKQGDTLMCRYNPQIHQYCVLDDRGKYNDIISSLVTWTLVALVLTLGWVFFAVLKIGWLQPQI